MLIGWKTISGKQVPPSGPENPALKHQISGLRLLLRNG
jgi:hypothetical protein